MANKVKVRIAVAVDSTGHWACAGWGGASDAESMDCAVEMLKEGERRYWIEAELEMPDMDVPVIQVTGAKED